LKKVLTVGEREKKRVFIEGLGKNGALHERKLTSKSKQGTGNRIGRHENDIRDTKKGYEEDTTLEKKEDNQMEITGKQETAAWFAMPIWAFMESRSHLPALWVPRSTHY